MRITPAVAAACGVVLVSALGAQAPQAPDVATADEWYNAVRGTGPRLEELLTGSPAGVNLRDRRGGVSPLMHAAALGSLDSMRRLLDTGADVNAKSAAGATALMWAAADPAKVRLLVERGADVKAVSESGRTALLLAAMSDRSADTVRLLLERGADAKALDRDQTSTLAAAAYGNDTATLQLLLNAGAPVNQANVAGITALMNAASNGNDEAVKLLLAAGANVNAVSTAPAQQVKNGTIDLGRFTPLILASAYGPAKVVRTLLDAGANINAQEARGMTPLMYAAATDHGDIEIARMLLARSADLNVKSTAGETALDWANKSGSTPLAALLRKVGAPSATAPLRKIPDAAPLPHRPSIQRGTALVERASNTFFTNGACGACHAQNIADITVAAVRKAGLPVNDAAAGQRTAGASAAFAATATRLYERFDGPALDILLYTLAGFLLVPRLIRNQIREQAQAGLNREARVADVEAALLGARDIVAEQIGLPAPPAVGLIVKQDWQGRWMDDNGGDWTEFVSGSQAAQSGRVPGWGVADHDVAVIDPKTLAVNYQQGLMNVCMALAVNPATGAVTVVGTEATNEVRFEPNVSGVFTRVVLASAKIAAPILIGTPKVGVRDLNAHLDYSSPMVVQSERDRSLGDPRGIVWTSAGTRGYVSGMGSNNVIVIDETGQRVGLAATIEVGEGPTGLADRKSVV